MKSFEKISQYDLEMVEDINARTQAEIDYDNLILRELLEGKDICEAMLVADKEYPDEMWLIRGDDDVANLRRHYQRLSD